MFASKGVLDQLSSTSYAPDEQLLDKRRFDLMADWRYFAVLGAMKLHRSPPRTVEQVAKKFQFSNEEARSILQELIAFGLVALSSAEKYVPVEMAVFRTPDDFPKSLMDQRMMQSIKGAQQALENSKKVHSGAHALLRINPRKLPEAEKMLEEFLKKICMYLSEEDTTEIFELNINLYSRSNLDG
jgi:uncharacterized protein (TIGR02147 family)